VQSKKFLIIRFSSIGDIVLTTPIIRALKKQHPGGTVHFVTKDVYKETLKHNPYLDKIHTFQKDVSEIYTQLKAENYDIVIDLHKNLRSLRLKKRLKVKSYSFDKLNLRKLLAVILKNPKFLPDRHIVDRYFDAVAPLQVQNDGEGLDYFLAESDTVEVDKVYFEGKPTKFIALVVGGSYYTKKIPLLKLDEICKLSRMPVFLLGGKEDKAVADMLEEKFSQVINTCGYYTINKSASILCQAELVITPDTGLMHIASAFGKKMVSIWGNTIPEFGMSPYKANPENIMLQVNGLRCRPCSKLGYSKCPQGHFKCMLNQDLSLIGL
jgi:ADP-heptose:LPS heptosyltransferase